MAQSPLASPMPWNLVSSAYAAEVMPMCRAEMGASFADVEVHRFTHAHTAPSAGALWESIARTMAPILLMRTMLGETRWTSVDRAARDAIAAVIGAGPAEMPMTALVSTGVAR
jgi:hypothetical protein